MVIFRTVLFGRWDVGAERRHLWVCPIGIDILLYVSCGGMTCVSCDICVYHPSGMWIREWRKYRMKKAIDIRLT